MTKVVILDETGHTEIAVDTMSELMEKVELKDKFVFCDGKFTHTVDLNGVTEMPNEIVITESLIGG